MPVSVLPIASLGVNERTKIDTQWSLSEQRKRYDFAQCIVTNRIEKSAHHQTHSHRKELSVRKLVQNSNIQKDKGEPNIKD